MDAAGQGTGTLPWARLAHYAGLGLTVLAGAAGGFVVTLALVVIRAQFGSYIFALEDLAAYRLELLPTLGGAVAGGWLAARRPQAVPWAIACGIGGIGIGACIGALVGGMAWQADTGAWAGGVVGAGAGWLAGSLLSLRIRKVPRKPVVTGLASTLTFLGAVAFALMGATNLLKLDVAEFPVIPGIPIPVPETVDAVVFLVGDAGNAVTGEYPLLAALQEDVNRWSRGLGRDSAVSVIYLGDNVYPEGVRDRSHPGLRDDSARLWSQVAVLGTGDARRHHSIGLFVAGNHDWGNATGDAGVARLVNQGGMIADARRDGRLVALLPDAGQPGPVFRDLRQNVRIVFFDTHWFLQERGEGARRDFFLRMEAILASAGERSVILVSHHPYRSAGPHGAIIPGHHVGGLAYILKRAGALVQDLDSPAYDDLRNGLLAVFSRLRQPPLAYAGGHDHSLQLFTGGPAEPRFSIVSGAGSKVSTIATEPDLRWGASRPGYMMLVFRKDDGVDLFAVAGRPDRISCEGPADSVRSCMTEATNAFEIAFWIPLLPPPQRDVAATRTVDTTMGGTPWWTEPDSIASITDPDRPGTPLRAPPVAVSTRALAAGADSLETTPGQRYEAGWLHRLLAGDLNRHLWTVPMRLPVLDLQRHADGLAPEELIGGQQTVGIRFLGRDSIEYDFRPVVKDASPALPAWLRGSVARQVVNDQMAAQFPFAAIVVARLLQAADVASPIPRAVVMPNDERLGPYRALFAGRVGLLEEHARSGGGRRLALGVYRDVLSTEQVREWLRQNPGDSIRADLYVRARLIDFLVGDWDRHGGQWRWGRAPEDSTHWYPIPEDRDWALSRVDGLTEWIARILRPSYVGFSADGPPVERLARSALTLDQDILGTVPRDAFEREAAILQRALSDSVIDDAIAALPASLALLEHDRAGRALKQRRDRLVQAAGAFHDVIQRSRRP